MMIGSPIVHKTSGDGSWVKIKQTEEEQEQSCYKSLMESVRREEFDKNIAALLKNYIGDMDDWSNIHIKITFHEKDRSCEMNIGGRPDLKYHDGKEASGFRLNN